jgi:hypothetical protein
VEPQVRPLSASGERSSPQLQPSPTAPLNQHNGANNNTNAQYLNANYNNQVNNNNNPAQLQNGGNNNNGNYTPLVSLAKDSFTNKRAGSFAFNQVEMDEFNFQPSTGSAGSDVIRDVARALIQQGNVCSSFFVFRFVFFVFFFRFFLSISDFSLSVFDASGDDDRAAAEADHRRGHSDVH